MNLKEKGYEIEVGKESIKPFEEKILFSGMCDFIVPMSFSDMDDNKKITYDCSGYASVRDMKLKTSKEVFEILEKTILTLNKTVDFFIPPERVTLSKDTVYYNLKNKSVKIAYMPEDGGTLINHLDSFIDELAEDSDEDTAEYLDCVKKDLHYYNKNLKDMASFISEQRKRIYQCEIR